MIGTTLGAANVSGQRTTAAATLKIVNNGNIASAGSGTIAFYVSLSTAAAAGALIRNENTSLALKPGASRTIRVPLQSLQAVNNGDYYLVAQVTDPKEDVTSTASGGTFDLAAPFTMLVPSGPLVRTTAGGATISFTITNEGNVTPVGASTIAFFASPNDSISGTTSVLSQSVTLKIPAGKSKILRVKPNSSQLSSLKAANAAILEVSDPMGGSQTLIVAI